MSGPQPIHVRLTVGREVRELALIADPADALVSVQVGQAVSEAILSIGTTQDGLPASGPGRAPRAD